MNRFLDIGLSYIRLEVIDIIDLSKGPIASGMRGFPDCQGDPVSVDTLSTKLISKAGFYRRTGHLSKNSRLWRKGK